MPTIIIKALLLVPVFFLGLTAGAYVGYLYQALRYGPAKRRRMHESTLQPFAIGGAVLAVVAVAIYWQVTGR